METDHICRSNNRISFLYDLPTRGRPTINVVLHRLWYCNGQCIFMSVSHTLPIFAGIYMYLPHVYRNYLPMIPRKRGHKVNFLLYVPESRDVK